MEAGGGFVEDVEVVFAAFEFAEFAGQFDALGFAAAEGVADFQVAQAQFVQRFDFAQDRGFVGEEVDAFFDAQPRQKGRGKKVSGEEVKAAMWF